MEPSWTFPIPQAMQQHRGSQLHKLPQPTARETANTPAHRVKPEASAQPGAVERTESRDVMDV
jgi:hypothetical protein